MYKGLLRAFTLILLAHPAGMPLLHAAGPPSVADELSRLRTSIRTASETGKKDLHLKGLRRLRDLQVQYGAMDSALATCLQTVELSGFSDDRRAIANDWRQLALTSEHCGDLTGATEAAKRWIFVLKTTNDPPAEWEATLVLLDLLSQAGRYDEFKRQADVLLANFERAGDLSGKTRVLYRQGELLTSVGRAPDALSLLHTALRSEHLIPEARERARIHFALARANAEVANWPPARAAFEEGIALDPGAPGSSAELYGLLARICEGQGDLSAAVKYERLRNQAQDSLFSAAMADKAIQLRTLYGVRSQMEDLASLQDANQVLQARLQSRKWGLRWSLVLAGALSVAVLLLAVLLLKGRTALQRAHLRNRVATDRIRTVESERSELADQHDLLARALMQAEARGEQRDGVKRSVHCDVQLMELLLNTLGKQAGNTLDAMALAEVQSRIDVMGLIRQNVRKGELLGTLNLRAHFASLADMLLREHHAGGRVHVQLTVQDADDLVPDLLPLSLLFTELLRISIAHVLKGHGESTIKAVLRRVDMNGHELLYTDSAGAIQTGSLDGRTASSALMRTWATSMGGSILLLKGEATTLQFTFPRQASGGLRRAS